MIKNSILTIFVAFLVALGASSAMAQTMNVTSIITPNSTTAGSVINFTINGAITSNGETNRGGIILQIPAGMKVLRAHYDISVLGLSGDLNEDPSMTSGYTAEPGRQLYGGSASYSGPDVSSTITLKVWLAVPSGVTTGDYTIKAVVGGYTPANTWIPQNPQNNSTPITNFSQISGNYASNTINVAVGSPDTTPPADVTPTVSQSGNSALSVDVSSYNEAAQGDVAGYHIYLSKSSFTNTSSAQLLNGTTSPSVAIYNVYSFNDVNFSSDISGSLYYFELAPGSEFLTSISGLSSNTIYYFAVTAVDISGNESNPIVESGIIVVGSIAGTVTSGGNGVQGVSVSAYDANNGNYVSNAETDSSGDYVIPDILSGDYKIYFDGSPVGYIGQWHSNKPDFSTADAASVTAPNATGGINAVLVQGGSISGTMTPGINGFLNAEVGAYDIDGNWLQRSGVDSNGNYHLLGLPSGNYKIEFLMPGYINQWYDNKVDSTGADQVSVTAPNNTTGIDVALTPGLVVTKSGKGDGVVVFSSNGNLSSYSFGSTELVSCDYDAFVTMTAYADPLSTFAGWSGDCTVNTNGTCAATVTGARNVMATFNPLWISLNGSMTISPPATTWDFYKYYVAIRGIDNGIYVGTTNADGVFNNDWTKLPTGSTSDKPAIAWNSFDNRLYMVVRGGDNGIYTSSVDSSLQDFSGWTRLPGSTLSAPAVVSTWFNSISIVVRGGDNRIFTSTLDSSMNFSGWTKLPTGSTPDAPAVAWNPNDDTFYIFVRGGDTKLYGTITDSSMKSFNGWAVLPKGTTPSAPAITWNVIDNKLHIVVKGNDNKIYSATVDSAMGSFSGWSGLSGNSTPLAPAVACDYTKLHVFITGSDNKIYEWAMLY